MSFRDDLLPLVNSLRALPGEMGLRQYTVILRTVVSTGTRFGEGATETTDTVLTVGNGQPPKVKQLFDKDTVAGGLLTKARFTIELTPDHVGGGYTPTELNPEQGTSPKEVFYILKGPGMPATGMLCAKVADDFSRPFKYTITVETLGKAA
jgi:hypothetical protein